jgi:hypothetical protein
MTDEFGILYVSIGAEYIQECERSAWSVRSLMPDIPISIWVDADRKFDPTCFDSVHVIEAPKENRYLERIELFRETKYRKTIYLDSDTYLLDSVYEIAELLDRFDLACAHAPVRIPKWESPSRAAEIPISFPQLNAGVIAYRKNELVLDFFQSWARIYQEQLEGEHPPKHDQPALREALYFSELRVAILPPEYNIRTHHPFFTGRGLPVKILHGRDPSLSRLIRELNQSEEAWVYDPWNTGKMKRYLKRFLRVQ